MRSTSDGRIAMNAGVGLGLEADSASCQHNEHGKIKPQDKLLAAQVSIATIGLGACLVICKTFMLELPCEGAAMNGTSICREAKITAFSASCQSAEGCQR